MADGAQLKIILVDEGGVPPGFPSSGLPTGSPTAPTRTIFPPSEGGPQLIPERISPPSIPEKAAPQWPPGQGTGLPSGTTEMDWRKAPPPVRAGLAEGAKAENMGAGLAAQGGEAAGAGGLAALAGPAIAVAGALVVADLAAKTFATGIKEAGENVRRQGEVFGRLVMNDNMGALTAQADAAAITLGKIPIVGQVLEETIKAGTTVLRTFESVLQSVIARGRELSPYSGELIAAQTKADVRSMMADIREAQVLGPSMAHVTDQWSEIQNDLREMLLPIKKFLIETLAQFLDTIKPLFDDLKTVLVIIEETIKHIAEAADQAGGLHLPTALKILENLPRDIARRLKEDKMDLNEVPMFKELMHMGSGGLPKFGVPPDPNIVFNQQMAIPALSG